MKTGLYFQDPKYAVGDVRPDFIFDPSLVLYLPLYKLDGASFMSKDAYGHLCTVTGALWTPRGRGFDGVDDRITVGNESFWDTLLNGQNPFSVGFWYKADKPSDIATIWAKGNDPVFTGLYNGTHGGSPSATDFQFQIKKATDDQIHISITNIYAKDIWQHWSIAYDGSGNASGVEIDVNNVRQSLTIRTDNLVPPMTNNRDLKLGIGVITTWFLSGLLGEFWLNSRMLTPQERQHNYLATKWRYR